MQSNDNQSIAFKRRRAVFFSIPFCLSILLIIFTAVGLRPMLYSLEQYYLKEPIEPNVPLRKFKVLELSSFQEGWNDRKASVPESVGTDEYIFTYLNRQDINKVPRSAYLFVTYYSDPKDKVAHSPDVCYRQAGAIVKEISSISIERAENGESSTIPAKMILFEMPDGYQQVVIFTYCVEGVFRDKRWETRRQIAKPGNCYTYYSKIETAVPYSNEWELKDAADLCELLFTEATMSLAKDHFPSLEEIKR